MLNIFNFKFAPKTKSIAVATCVVPSGICCLSTKDQSELLKLWQTWRYYTLLSLWMTTVVVTSTQDSHLPTLYPEKMTKINSISTPTSPQLWARTWFNTEWKEHFKWTTYLWRRIGMSQNWMEEESLIRLAHGASLRVTPKSTHVSQGELRYYQHKLNMAAIMRGKADKPSNQVLLIR